jgi:arsenite oxidase small subunit
MNQSLGKKDGTGIAIAIRNRPTPNQENTMADPISRRDFFKISSSVAAGVGATVAGVGNAQAAPAPVPPGQVNLPYPTRAVGKASTIQSQPLMFAYPDAASPCAAVKLGKPVKGGVGPNGDIVAYSTLCTHMGCPVVYDGQGTFKCGCHFSQFDAEKGGQMICGQATENLPRVRLEYNSKTDTVNAVGVDGLIYGRQANIL